MKFECKNCGQCCKDFGGGDSIPVFEWEAERLKEIAKKKKIPLKIEPMDLALDEKSGFILCIHFVIKQKPCPFLKNNKCSIYEDRPLMCKCYPLVKTPLCNLKGEITNLSSFGKCKNFDAKNFLGKFGAFENTQVYLKKSEVIAKYEKTFGEEMFISAFQMDNRKKFIDWIMKDLIKNQKIKLKEINKSDYNSQVYPLIEFLVKANLINEEKKEEIIKSFNDINKFKEIITHFKNS